MEYERLYPRTRVSAPIYTSCSGRIYKVWNMLWGKTRQCMQYAMRNLHPEGLFTVRLLKVFAYIPTAYNTATLCVVVVSNCIDITFPTRPMLAIFGVVYLQVQNRESRLLIIVPLAASLNATRVAWQTRCNDHSCALTQRIFSYTNTIRSCVSILREQNV